MRKRAVSSLRASGKTKPTKGKGQLQYELDVHQLQLEMQNEELKRARAELEAGLERYAALFDFAPVGYVILRAEGTIRELNHAAAGLLGRMRSLLLGRPFDALVAHRHRARLTQLLVKARLEETRETCEVELPRGDSPLQVRLAATALTRGEPMILLAIEDLTEQNRRERELEEGQIFLREIDHRKNDFLAVLSHELRNPLAPIRNSLFLLRRGAPQRELAQEALTIIDRQVTLLTRLVDDLLDVARIARGKIELTREPVDLSVVVRRTLYDHRMSFDASGIVLEERIDPGVFWVDADAARLTQALSNLLSNAEKYTPRGGTVLVSLRSLDERNVALRVHDTGAGIEAHVLPHVFESFVQSRQTMSHSRGGLGLGLSMVKGIVELHGGAVKAESAGPGRGTIVTVVLPTREAPERAQRPETAPREGERRRVLVIDDNADNTDSIRFGLEMVGHTVAVAYDGFTGVRVARTFRPDVVVSDLGLPDLNGYEVARTLRAEDDLKDVFLIAVSGYVRPEDVERSTAAGFDHHLGKPVGLEELDQLISAPRPTKVVAVAPNRRPRPDRPH
jgi:PAS domain S-box-containing protein